MMSTVEATVKVNTSTLLGEYAALINKHGVESSEARSFLDTHSQNKEFVELAQTANFLRVKLDRYQAQGQSK